MGKIIKKVDLVFLQEKLKLLQEIASDIKISQEQLEDMLSAIDSNTMDFNKGKISKDLFKENDKRLRKESASLIKKINYLVNKGIKIMDEIVKHLKGQVIVVTEKEKR